MMRTFDLPELSATGPLAVPDVSAKITSSGETLSGRTLRDHVATLKGKAATLQCGTIPAAAEAAFRDAEASGQDAVVLLSPACASFDQFKDYEARGAAFRAAVEALG